jgi:hypothetical protein
MAFCGACGTSLSDTTAFCTNCGSPTTSPKPNATLSSSGPTERVLFDECGVFVSQSRFVSGGKTYAMSGITSIGSEIVNPSKKGPILGMLIGLFMAIAGFTGVNHGGGPTMVVGLVVFAIGLLVFISRKTVHMVVLRSASSEQTDSALVQRIIDALNQAVVIRG